MLDNRAYLVYDMSMDSKHSGIFFNNKSHLLTMFVSPFPRRCPKQIWSQGGFCLRGKL
jgi:hypothetical protein